MGHDAGTVNDFVGIFAHQTIIAGQIGFALGAVEQQGFKLFLGAQIQLYCRRKCSTTHADDAGLGHAVIDGMRIHGKRIGDRGGQLSPFVFAIGFEDDGFLRQTRRMGGGDICNRCDAARCWRMLWGRYRALTARDHLAFLDQVACGNQSFGRCADMLLEWDIQRGG